MTAAWAKGVPYLIEVESYDPTPVVDEPTEIVIALYDPADPGRRLEDQDLLADLDAMEIRHVPGTAVIRPRFERLDRISFRAEVTYSAVGEWQLIMHPGFTEREFVPTDYPLELTVDVGSAPAATTSGDWEGLAAVIGFAVLLFLIIIGITRSRQRMGVTDPPDNPGDTWWSGG